MVLQNHRCIRRKTLTVALALFVVANSAALAEQWTTPTKEELSMTSLPQAPGAAAVYLFREETQQDYLHMYTQYVRLKVLAEGGKEKANVELKYGGGMFDVTDIAGRTIHPDGTIVPFTGKPYERTVVKTSDFKQKAKVFTLPDVTVGSIIEYRYKLRWQDHYYVPPVWIVQDDLYLRKGHFLWRPTDGLLYSSDARAQKKTSIEWTPLLPVGAAVKMTTLPNSALTEQIGTRQLELSIEDVAASPNEEYMPPIGSLGYRVLFYYSAYRNGEEFWRGEGNYWSKTANKFIGPGQGVDAAVAQLTAPSDTPEQKLKKIYAAVERLENTNYTREHTRVEDRADGLKTVSTTDEIWAQKRGTANQITGLFVAMARAAGMKAYVMRVTDRDRSLFLPSFLSLYQLDDDIAIVVLDGKEQYFDPGSRYCPYGHLAWKHTEAGGLRQIEGGTEITSSPGETYLASGENRVANLNLDETGVVSGRIDLRFTGAPALKWRQKALTADKESVERELKESVEHMLANGMEVKLLSINKLEEYEEPLAATFLIKGSAGSATGKRLLVTGDLFEGSAKPTFAHEKRDLFVYFPYRYSAHDVIRINFPQNFAVESVPSEGSFKFPKMAIYSLKTTADPHGVTIHRDLYLAEILYKPADYSDLRNFYSQFEAKDQEPIILKVAAASPAGN